MDQKRDTIASIWVWELTVPQSANSHNSIRLLLRFTKCIVWVCKQCHSWCDRLHSCLGSHARRQLRFCGSADLTLSLWCIILRTYCNKLCSYRQTGQIKIYQSEKTGHQLNEVIAILKIALKPSSWDTQWLLPIASTLSWHLDYCHEILSPFS